MAFSILVLVCYVMYNIEDHAELVKVYCYSPDDINYFCSSHVFVARLVGSYGLFSVITEIPLCSFNSLVGWRLPTYYRLALVWPKHVASCRCNEMQLLETPPHWHVIIQLFYHL